MLMGEFKQFSSPHHSAVILHYLAAQAAVTESGNLHKVDSSLRMTCPHKHPSFPRLKREHMSRTAEIFRTGVRIRTFQGGDRAFHGRDSRRSGNMVNRNGKSSAVIVSIFRNHLFQA